MQLRIVITGDRMRIQLRHFVKIRDRSRDARSARAKLTATFAERNWGRDFFFYNSLFLVAA